MARPLTRDEKVAAVLEENRHRLGFQSSLGYAEAYVDGQISIENNFEQKIFDTFGMNSVAIKKFLEERRNRIQERYNLIMSAKTEEDRQIIILFGRTSEEILEALDAWEKDQIKMTRDEAAAIIQNKVFGLTDTGQAKKWADALEALGFIKFDKPKVSTHFSEATEKYGTVRVEEWPEGLVVWVGGKIRYKSWE